MHDLYSAQYEWKKFIITSFYFQVIGSLCAHELQLLCSEWASFKALKKMEFARWEEEDLFAPCEHKKDSYRGVLFHPFAYMNSHSYQISTLLRSLCKNNLISSLACSDTRLSRASLRWDGKCQKSRDFKWSCRSYCDEIHSVNANRLRNGI